MGNTLLPPQTSSQILNKYWQPITSNLYRNRTTHQLIKQKKLTFRTEDQMNYVFNCLLKRMNNYQPGVIKIVYLRKMVELLSLCECGKRFVVLVYVEYVELRLKEFVESEDRLIQNFRQRYDHKCICLSLIKSSKYLKQRYGPFRVTQHNTWIQVPKQLKQSDLISYNTLLPNTKCDYTHSIKLKLWISSQEQQNFPDQSCQQKQMVLSIIEVLMHWIVPKGLCKCYSDSKGLERYLQVSRVGDLMERICKDHQYGRDTATLTKTLANVQVVNNKQQPAQFQRTIRLFSSNDPGHHSTYPHHTHQIINQHNSQLVAQTKYTSIEYVRKQPVENGSVGSEKKISKTPQMINQVSHFFSPTAKPLLLQPQLPKYHSFQHVKTHQNPIKNGHSLTKNQCKALIKFQVPPQTYHTEKHPQPQPFTHPKPQPFNPKLKYRHGNSIYSRPIIGIADLPGQVTTHIPSITIPSHHQTPKEETTQKSQSPSVVNQMPTERENLVRQECNSKVFKINLQEDLSKRHIQISLDKRTNPTDRSKIDISSKSQQKKQPQAITSSRKNISVIPISLDTTNGATINESFKPILHSQGHINKPTSTHVSGQLQMPKIKDSSIILQEKSKKQSASSSKSQQNYMTYQINLATSKTKEEMGKFVPRKLSSSAQDHQVVNQKVLQKHTNNNPQAHRQKSYSFVNKIQTLAIATSNGDIGRLRQSEYIVTGQNSLMNSKSISIGESKPLRQEGLEIGSLKEMEAKFPTLQDLENYENIGIQNSESHLFIQPQTNSLQQIHNNNSNPNNQRDPDIMISHTKPINLHSNHQFNQSSYISNPKSSNISQTQNANPKSHSFSSNPSNPRAPIPKKQLQHILSDKMPSIILKQQHEETVINMQKVTQEEYKVKVSSGSQKQKMHHKKMSNPTFDKHYIKTKALKQEFSQLLNQPKQNSFKALTESKDKLIKLDNNQGRETYSINNESEYNTSEQLSKRQSQHDNLAGSGEARPPLSGKEHGKQTTKWRKPFSKQELQKELQEKKQGPKTPPNQQVLRLTSSGHQDNSIKQKVRSKKAQFAELKNQMNSLLL